MSIPKIVVWTITGTVTTETPDGVVIPRQVPTLRVDAASAKDALEKYRDIVTAAWHGPCKVSFDVGMQDETANYFRADQDGVKF